MSRRDYEYQFGSAARQLDFETLMEEEPRKEYSHAARRNREKAERMGVGSIIFLMCALTVAAVTLIGYIKLKSDNTGSAEQIAQMQRELYALQQENNEYETRVSSSVNLEEIKRIAICELGMKYACEGQIVLVDGGGNDYARKYAEVPEE